MSAQRVTKVVRPLRRGQITIPAEFRRSLGITDDTLLHITLEDGGLRITRVAAVSSSESGPNAWLRELHAQFAPVRQAAEVYSDSEIDEVIDQAVREARQSREPSRRDV